MGHLGPVQDWPTVGCTGAASLAVRWLAVCGAGLFTAACTESNDLGTARTDSGLDGPLIYAEPATSGMDAATEGVLVLDQDCLLLDHSPNFRTVIIWPHGTDWDPTTERVITNRGEVLPIGAALSTSGGAAPSDLDTSGLVSANAYERIRDCIAATGAEGAWLASCVSSAEQAC